MGADGGWTCHLTDYLLVTRGKHGLMVEDCCHPEPPCQLHIIAVREATRGYLPLGEEGDGASDTACEGFSPKTQARIPVSGFADNFQVAGNVGLGAS